MRNRIARALPWALLLIAAPAAAHVTLVDANAKTAGNFVATFRVGHGCAGSSTTALTIDIPAGVTAARPGAKAGWTVSMTHAPLPKPVPGEGGEVTERVSSVTWTGGPLPGDQFDEFSVILRMPDAPGTLNFPVTQVCEKGSERWSELPDGSGRRLTHPAPVLTLTQKASTP